MGKWQKVERKSDFNPGWELKYVETGVNGRSVMYPRGAFEKINEIGFVIADDTSWDWSNGRTRFWYQRRPKNQELLPEPKTLHSAVQVAGRQFMLCDTSDAGSKMPWVEITEYAAGEGGWTSWRRINELGTPEPFHPKGGME